MSSAAAVTKGDFEEEVLKSPIPVMVDFWAIWCGPCKQIAPAVDDLATEYAGKLKVLKVNVDEEQEISERYGIQSIPTLLFFKDGKQVDRIMGAYPRRQIAAKIDSVLTA
ncbi:MAG: thioredoxin [Armatimonadetes bacterium]|nr:thioredoxin [Armatimonadota bacterium]MDE2208072.1 thioredoxin [Armatimonadota bacterium]